MENKEWWDHSVKEIMLAKLRGPTVTIPNAVATEEMPADCERAPPPAPRLKRAPWLPAKEDSLLPLAAVSIEEEKQWATHMIHAEEFKGRKTAFNGEFCGGAEDTAQPTNEGEPTPNKISGLALWQIYLWSMQTQ